MKNIHILPTDKPSRLTRALHYNNSLRLVHENYKCDVKDEQYQNIYITSDEDIKDGDWFICQHGFEKKCVGTTIVNNEVYLLDYLGNTDRLIWCKKIILTTDQGLIKDGVQAIDDEFLEWFVKNPSCEYVEIKKSWFGDSSSLDGKYKIIIPKEEPKQETLEEVAETQLYITINKIIDGGKNLPKGYSVTRGQAVDYAFKIALEVAKWQQEQNNENSWFNEYQEVENYIIKRIGDKFLEATPEKYNTASQATIALLENNWKKEQNNNLYSEEDVKQFGLYLGNNFKKLKGKIIDEIFEQFKKEIKYDI